MHAPDTTPRPSIFYDYRIHPFRPPPEMAGGRSEAPVVVVGAGPIGLVTALDLARFGVRSIVLEQELQVSHGSRALALTRRSLEILQQAGVVAPFMAKGLPWSSGRTFYRGHEVYRMLLESDPDDRFPPMLNLQQQYIEQYLAEAAAAAPLIDLRWGHQLTGLEQGAAEVRLSVDTPAGAYALHSPWVVAADGGRSAVRQMMGLRMEGRAYAGSFVILDIRADLGLPTERLCYFDPDWNPHANVLVHRAPDGMWRLDFKLPEGETPEAALRPERIAERVAAILRMIGREVPWELDWGTIYSANTLTLADYVHGRVLFTGDAVHLLPIFGVRGANTGLQDCENLAWKLALVARGEAPRALLDSYSHERVRAAREICEEAGKSTRFMTPPSAGYALMRDAVLSLSLSEAFVRNLLHWRTSRPHDYFDSPLNAFPEADAAIEGGYPCGAPIRNARLGPDDYLFDHLGTGFHLIGFPATPDAARRLVAACEAAAAARPAVRRVVVTAAPDRWQGLAETVLADPGGRLARRFGMEAGGLYLVRPDLHVAARWREPTAEKLRAALAIACGGERVAA
jgi:3-(3-hydroxy-phenyl)propionate hydroxylase